MAMNDTYAYCDWLFSQDLTLNRDKYYAICCEFELNLTYLSWLFSLFRPMLTFIFVLYLLPIFLAAFVYACSIFLFLKKHWFRLKVSIVDSTPVWHNFKISSHL
jgi:hypothetical protein